VHRELSRQEPPSLWGGEEINRFLGRKRLARATKKGLTKQGGREPLRVGKPSLSLRENGRRRKRHQQKNQQTAAEKRPSGKKAKKAVRLERANHKEGGKANNAEEKTESSSGREGE